MMEDAAKKLKKQPRRDRVTLDPVAITRLNGWIDEVRSQLRGVQISRSDLVNFLIIQRSEVLTSREIHLLKEAHFDESDFAQWALKEFKKAKDRGEDISLADILKPVFPATSPRPKRVKKPETPIGRAESTAQDEI
jgi:hypothetical protein